MNHSLSRTMNRLFVLLSVLVLALMGPDVLAQKKDSANDYNLKKAYEVLKEEKDEAKALELVTEQLNETPDNVDALILRVRLLRRKSDYGHALQDINHALKVNKPKKTEVANSTLHWWKGFLYQDMLDFDNAAISLKKAYELAQKDNKENLQSISFDYAQLLYYKEDYTGSDVIYRKMLSEDEADQGAMVGLARNMIARKQYKEALEVLDKCRQLSGDYSEIYRFRLQAFNQLGEETKAIDSALDWFDKDDDASMDSIIVAAKKRPNYAEAQMKVRSKKSENPVAWKVLLCRFYEDSHNYIGAIRLYDEIEAEYGRDNRLNAYRSSCYNNLGLHDRAIADISKAVENSHDWYSYSARGDYYRIAGKFQEAIEDFTAAINERPDLSYPYYKRGWCYELMGDKEKALEEYNLGIEIDDDYPYLYLMRGTLLLEKGNQKEAKADFETILKKDTLATDGSCRQYALHYLGRDNEAKEWMEKIIATDPDDAGHYYDKACLYARIGDKKTAIAALRTAFEKGYRSFSHIKYDDDMDPIRNEPEFLSLVGEYKAKHDAFLKESDIIPETGEESISEIAFKRHGGGTFEIPCDINGLPLQMIFDTGASDVTISSVEANFMLKNGYLSDNDIKGKRYYQVANGELSAGTIITLREVKIGDAILKNVDASVVKSQRAPLLLGQSAMERFGTITIDNINNKLIIKH